MRDIIIDVCEYFFVFFLLELKNLANLPSGWLWMKYM